MVRLDRPLTVGYHSDVHQGHAGAMLQARRLGNELVVGVHSDEEIFENKGPTVMTLKERSVRFSLGAWELFPLKAG